MPSPTFEVLLEKKGRGRGFALARPWAVRTFKLKGQTLEYYDAAKFKGTISIAGGIASVISSKEGDDKPFPFALDAGGEKLLMNASDDLRRQRCIQIFNLAAKDANWTMPPEPGQQTAAVEAVIGILAADVEKARLQAEQRQLEEERLKEVTAATAKMMEEELANVKLRQAAEAEQKQREEQERHITEMLKGLGAKARFRAARAEGRQEVMLEAAACMLQGAWRCKQARRRMLIKKAEKEALQREAYARRIQCRYRVRLARRRMAVIKAEKMRIKERLAAIRFQCAWRIHKARRLYRNKKQSANERKQAAAMREKLLKAVVMVQCAVRIRQARAVYRMRLEAGMAQQVNKSISRQRRILTIQSIVRRFLACRRAARYRVAYPMIVSALLHKLDGASKGNEDISAIVSGLVLAFPIGHPALVNPAITVPLELVKSAGKITSHCRMEGLGKGQPALATALNQLDFVVVTLLDKNEFLGQAIIKVSDVLRSAHPSEYTAITHNTLVFPLLDSNQSPLVQAPRSPVINPPRLTIGLSVSPPAFSMCGWLWKVSESLLSKAFKKRWFVLMDGQLTYFNSDLCLEASKNIVNCSSVTSLKEDSYKGRHAWKLAFVANGVESCWLLDFDENESGAIKEMWLRKLRRCCPALHEAGAARSPSKPAAGEAAGKAAGQTRIPVSRRVSIFK